MIGFENPPSPRINSPYWPKIRGRLAEAIKVDQFFDSRKQRKIRGSAAEAKIDRSLFSIKFEPPIKAEDPRKFSGSLITTTFSF